MSKLVKLQALGTFCLLSEIKKQHNQLKIFHNNVGTAAVTNVSGSSNNNNENIKRNESKKVYEKFMNKEAYKADKFFLDHKHIQPFVYEITKLGISEFKIVDAIMKNKEIVNYDISSVLSCISALQEYGFENEAIIHMIINFPKILSLTYNDIQNTIEMWKTLHYGEKFMIPLFTDNPFFFTLNDKVVKERVSFLKHYMEGKIGRVTNLILNSPDVLYSNWYQTEYKLNYLVVRMRVSVSQIAESKALSHPIAHIKLRHSFLEKAAIYKPPNAKEKGFNPHVNPTLTRILDTEDYQFACNVACMNIDEYEVYKNLINYMEEEKQVFDEESDDSSGEESDENSGEDTDDENYDDYRRCTIDYE